VNQQEGIGAGIVSGLCAGCTMIEMNSFWKQLTREMLSMVKESLTNL
jgi:hypothetical protein